MSRQRMMAIASACLLLLAGVDFFGRIYVPRHREARPESSFVPPAVSPPVPASRIRKDLATWLPRLRPIADAPSEAADTDWGLTLLAVFSDGKGTFAVVQATPAAGGDAKVRSVVEGDDLYGYKVSRIERRRILLKGDAGERELQLFKPDASRVLGTGPTTATAASAPAISRADAVPANPAPGAATPPQAAAASPQAPAPGPKGVTSHELKPGQAFELPESMKGMKVIEATPPPKKP